jgi:hypothetical protein
VIRITARTRLVRGRLLAKRPVSVRVSAAGLWRRGPVNPGHQLGNAADWIPGVDLGEGVGQIGSRFIRSLRADPMPSSKRETGVKSIH